MENAPSMSVAGHSMPAISLPEEIPERTAEELSGFFTAAP
jgi:hypothetical protein